MEVWKDVVGFEGIYEVSDKGNIRTVEGKITSNSRYNVRVWKQRIIKLKHDRNGYKRVSLWKSGKHYDWLVHRLVAIAFIPNPNDYPMINHIDGISNNNCIDNLEWCDSNHNVNHAFDNGLIYSQRVTLYRCLDGYKSEFRSVSKACEFLGRSRTYVYDKNGKIISGSNGIEYRVEFI